MKLSSFYEASLDAPEYRHTLHLPRVQGGEAEQPPTIYLNPLIPGIARHETRHVIHFQIARQVVEEDVDAAITYYEEELADLSPSYGFQWWVIRGMNKIVKEPSADGIYDRVRAGEDDPQTVTNLLLTKNAETNLQHEVFATRGGYFFPAELGVAAAAGLVNAAKYAQHVLPELPPLHESPKTYAVAAGSGLVAATIGRDLYDWAQGERLVEENLSRYDDPENRRRAMLHNSRVNKTLDGTLEMLTDYGL